MKRYSRSRRKKSLAKRLTLACLLPWALLAPTWPAAEAHTQSGFMPYTWPVTTAPMRIGFVTGAVSSSTGRADLHASDAVWNSSSVTPTFNFTQGLSDDSVYWTGNACTVSTGAVLWLFSGQLSGSTLASQYDCTDGSRIVRSAIRFDSSDRTWNTGTAGPSSGEVDLRSVATHEIGHGLGFTLHFSLTDTTTCDSSDISTMCPTYPGGTIWRSLTQHDIHTVLAAYQ